MDTTSLLSKKVLKSTHRKSMALGTIVDNMLLLSRFGGNTLQNRRVSSPAPVTRVYPSGLQERYNTRKVCPVRVASFFMLGYFHTIIWFWLYPWVETSSFTFLEKSRLHTWLPVSSELTG